MAQYDPNILQTFADRLYAKAAGMTVRCGFVGALVGLIVAVPVIIYANPNGEQAIVARYKGTGNGFDVPVRDETGSTSTIPTVPALIVFVAVVGSSLIGVLVGQRRGFEYRLEAQRTLCQMQTEFNTRQ
jgi:hypothetical protein